MEVLLFKYLILVLINLQISKNTGVKWFVDPVNGLKPPHIINTELSQGDKYKKRIFIR